MLGRILAALFVVTYLYFVLFKHQEIGNYHLFLGLCLLILTCVTLLGIDGVVMAMRLLKQNKPGEQFTDQETA